MMRKPAFDVSLGGRSILTHLDPRVTQLIVRQVRGEESDTAEFDLADDARMEIPKAGADLTVSMGYEDTGLVPMGLFTVGEVAVVGRIIQVQARAAALKTTLKTQRNGGWEKKTLGQIVSEIGQRHGIPVAVDSSLAQRVIPYISQTAESDLHFLTRLARAHGAVAKPAGGQIIFARRGTGQSVSGRPRGGIIITPADCIDASWRFTFGEPGTSGSVSAGYHDEGASVRKEEAAEDPKHAAGLSRTGDAAYLLRQWGASQEEAKWAAEGKAAEMAAAKDTFGVDMPGWPELSDDLDITTQGFRPGCNLPWVITEATHTIRGAEFTSSIEAEGKI